MDPNSPKLKPVIPIDWDEVDKYLIAGCSGVEVAAVIGCSTATLYDRCVQDNGIIFSEYSREKKAKGDSLLRAKQMQKAMSGKGDNTMLIFLGKARLGQRENDALAHQFDGKLALLMERMLNMKPSDEIVRDSPDSSDPQANDSPPEG